MPDKKRDGYETIKPIKPSKKDNEEAVFQHALFKSSRGHVMHKDEDEFDTPVPEERGKYFILDDSDVCDDYNKK